LCLKMALAPEVEQEATKVLREVKAQRSLSSLLKKDELLTLVALFIGSRRANQPIAWRVIVGSCAKSAAKELSRYYFAVAKLFQGSSNRRDVMVDYLESTCNKLEMTSYQRSMAHWLALNAGESVKLIGRQPKSLAAAAVFLVCRRHKLDKINLVAISKESRTSVSTIKLVADIMEGIFLQAAS